MKDIIVRFVDANKDETRFKKSELDSDVITLFKSIHSEEKLQNHYYFLEIKNDDNKLSANDILKEVEYEMSNINEHWSSVSAINRYVILIMEINELTLAMNKTIIEIEDNEYIYNKYVLFYTKKEKEAFLSSIIAMGPTDIGTSSYNIKRTFDAPETQLYLRILIKVPFLSTTYDIKELTNIETDINRGLGNNFSLYKDIERLEDRKLESEIDVILQSIWDQIEEQIDEISTGQN